MGLLTGLPRASEAWFAGRDDRGISGHPGCCQEWTLGYTLRRECFSASEVEPDRVRAGSSAHNDRRARSEPSGQPFYRSAAMEKTSLTFQPCLVSSFRARGETWPETDRAPSGPLWDSRAA